MKNSLRIYLFHVFVIAFSLGANGQKLKSPAKDKLSKDAQDIIEKVINKQGLVGTQAEIWYDGKVILKKSWGYANRELKAPVTDKTRFLVASIAKNLTGLSVLRLSEQGLIDLDTPIQTYLPNFPTKPEGMITSRMLIQHRSGIRHYRRGETGSSDFFAKHYETANEALEKFANDSLVTIPGTEVGYSSFGYAVLAAIIEKVSGENFNDYQKTKVFEPYKMINTEVPDWRYPIDKLASSYGFFLPHLGSSSNERPFQARRLDFSYNPGGGNLVSNSHDLIQYGKALLKDEEVIKRIMDDSKFPFTTFGWNLFRDYNETLVLHATGASEAYQGSITIWPKEKLIVVALSNTWGRNSRSGGFTLQMARDLGYLILN